MIGDIPDLIAKRASLTPDKAALEDAATGRTLTYAGLDARAARAAAVLAARGIGEGDRVALLARNRVAFFELLFGCAKLGAILVPLNWRMPPAELDGLLADAEPVLLLHGDQEAAAAGALAAPLPALNFDSDYAGARDAAPVGRWHGPVASRHGVHLVRIIARDAEKLPPFEDVEKQVRADWLTQETRGLRGAAMSLLPRYQISLPPELRQTLAAAPALAPFLARAR